MKAAARKLQTLTWYLRRPSLYPELVHELRVEIGRPLGRGREASAERWCAERAIDVAEAVELLTGSPMEYRVDERFGPELTAARERVRQARAAHPGAIPPAGAGHLDALYWLAERARAQRVIETGVAYGYSSLALLLSLRGRPAARLVSTDMPLPRTTGAYVGCAVAPELRAQWTLLTGLDRRVLPGALAELGDIDLCHYDSDKTYDGRTWAYGLLWDALRPGGWFVSDDIGDNAAFRDFCQRVRIEPVVVAESTGKHVGVLTKPGGH
jgi:predicted O-methyltransferase YrrM